MEHNAQRTVLMVSLCFPPASDSGSYRTVRFTRYLPDFGWKCIVVTVSDNCHPIKDYHLLDSISPAVEVYRFGCADPEKHLEIWQNKKKNLVGELLTYPAKAVGKIVQEVSIPDSRVWGIWRLYRILERLIKSQHIDVLWITGPPFSYFLVVPKIKRRFGLPVVLDMRDPWTTLNLRYDGTKSWRRPIEKFLEKHVFRSADKIILNTQGSCRHCMSAYPDMSSSKWDVLTNGFDVSELTSVPPQKYNCTTLVHAGITTDIRTSRFLIEAISRLKKEGVISPETFRFLSFGQAVSNEKKAVKTFLVKEMVEFLGSRPHNEVISSMRGADALLLLVANEHKQQIPGKLFEYLGIGKPIIMAGPAESDAAEIIRKTRSGVVVPIDNVHSFTEQLRNLVQGKFAAIKADSLAVKEYESRNLTSKLVAIFAELIKSS